MLLSYVMNSNVCY